MKEKIITGLLNLIKVKSIVTFATIGILFYCVKNDMLEPATITAIVMLVFNSLFSKDKKDSE